MILFNRLRFAPLWTGLALALSGLALWNNGIYLPGGGTPAFLLEKGELRHVPWWRAAFIFHVAGASICLASGAPLMFPRLLRRPRLHRVLGHCYVNSVLWAAAPTALLMAPYAKGGGWGTAGFALGAVLWWGTTWHGVRTIAAGDLPAHLRAMVRSYSLALSAPAFRVFQVGLFGLGWDDAPNYVASLWLSLAFSLWLSESCIGRGGLAPRRRPAPDARPRFSQAAGAAELLPAPAPLDSKLRGRRPTHDHPIHHPIVTSHYPGAV